MRDVGTEAGAGGMEALPRVTGLAEGLQLLFQAGEVLVKLLVVWAVDVMRKLK